MFSPANPLDRAAIVEMAARPCTEWLPIVLGTPARCGSDERLCSPCSARRIDRSMSPKEQEQMEYVHDFALVDPQISNGLARLARLHPEQYGPQPQAALAPRSAPKLEQAVKAAPKPRATDEAPCVRVTNEVADLMAARLEAGALKTAFEQAYRGPKRTKVALTRETAQVLVEQVATIHPSVTAEKELRKPFERLVWWCRVLVRELGLQTPATLADLDLIEKVPAELVSRVA